MNSRQHGVSRPARNRGLVANLAAAFPVARTGAPKTPRVTFIFLVALTATTLLTALTATLPAAASAFATPEAPPTFSNASSLPDGRVYEQVVPQSELNGNEAGASTDAFATGDAGHYGLASPDGTSVLFQGSGPIGESPWGASELFVASRGGGATGWRTHAVLPRTRQPITEIGGILAANPTFVDPSEDLSHVMVAGTRGTLAEQPNEACRGQVYLAGADPLLPADWLERSELANPIENCTGASAEGHGGMAVGGTPNFSTVYFTYPGTLLPEDASRAPHAGSGESVEAWGFYEYSQAQGLQEAGILPADSPYPGEPDPFGAVPAASGHGRAIFGNQVADDGTRAFFVSPDPASCEQNGGHNDCTTDPPELYVRETEGEGATATHRTVLVSQDGLLGDVGGLPASAPSGVLQMPNPAGQVNSTGALDGSYVFASSDGSHAFFQSTDALTEAAEELSPGSEPKTYDFDLETGVLTFLPGVVGEIVAVARTGATLAFVRPEGGGSPAELDLWSGPGQGSVTAVSTLVGPPSSAGGGENHGTPVAYISDADIVSDGSVLVFTTNTSLSASFNSAGGEQVYRYDLPTNTLGCVSCAPAGVKPRGDASMSALRAGETYEAREIVRGAVNDNAVSSDGDRIFFDSPDRLVSRDANTDSPEVPVVESELRAQGRDVYEWENGTVYLVSTGVSARDSYLLASSETGNDVFFATVEPGLAPGDTDTGYDVYDARIPLPGEKMATGPLPCEGAACQGPASASSVPAPAVSASFSGQGNPAPEPGPPAVKPKPPAETTAEHLAAALKTCRKDRNHAKRVSCERQARKRYPAAAKSSLKKGV